MSNKVYTDRTRTIAYQRCHRLGWLTTYEGGKGIQRKSLNAHLLIGSAVHAGINWLFKGIGIEDTIVHLQEDWLEETYAKQVDECLSEYQTQLLNDCWNLVEGQVRTFELVMLPKVLEEYEVLDTEKEECYLLDPEYTNQLDVYPELWWMARLDATLRHKVTQDIGPLSIKTTSRWDSRKESEIKHDMQGCSEMWTLQQRHLGAEWSHGSTSIGTSPVMFNQYLFLLKGNKKRQDKTGEWEFQSPLTKGYRKLQDPNTVMYGDERDYEYAHSYWWTCKEMHIKGHSKKGEAQWCEGQKKHNCQGWEGVDISQSFPGGIQAWIAGLASGTIQPTAQETEGILAQQFVFPAPIYRGQQEIERWKRATVAEKRQIIANAVEVDDAEKDLEYREECLDRLFPMYTHSCDYPSRCPMQEICHEGVDPLESGLYQIRVANHPIEENE